MRVALLVLQGLAGLISVDILAHAFIEDRPTRFVVEFALGAVVGFWIAYRQYLRSAGHGKAPKS